MALPVNLFEYSRCFKSIQICYKGKCIVANVQEEWVEPDVFSASPGVWDTLGNDHNLGLDDVCWLVYLLPICFVKDLADLCRQLLST